MFLQPCPLPSRLLAGNASPGLYQVDATDERVDTTRSADASHASMAATTASSTTRSTFRAAPRPKKLQPQPQHPLLLRPCQAFLSLSTSPQPTKTSALPDPMGRFAAKRPPLAARPVPMWLWVAPILAASTVTCTPTLTPILQLGETRPP